MRRAASIVLVVLVVCASAPRPHAQDEVQARMQEWSKALGVECAHCHVDDQWSLPYMPTFDLAYRMSKMVEELNAGPLKSMGGVTCNTCHQGAPIPPKITREQWEAAAKPYEAAFAGDNSLALQMGVFTASLGAPCSHRSRPWFRSLSRSRRDASPRRGRIQAWKRVQLQQLRVRRRGRSSGGSAKLAGQLGVLWRSCGRAIPPWCSGRHRR